MALKCRFEARSQLIGNRGSFVLLARHLHVVELRHASHRAQILEVELELISVLVFLARYVRIVDGAEGLDQVGVDRLRHVLPDAEHGLDLLDQVRPVLLAPPADDIDEVEVVGMERAQLVSMLTDAKDLLQEAVQHFCLIVVGGLEVGASHCPVVVRNSSRRLLQLDLRQLI